MTDPRTRKPLHTGLLVLRLGIGFMFILHGWPKLTGGVPVWKNLGSAMATLGVNFAPVVWGFLAAFAETIGGACLIIGVFVRPFSFLMLCTMIVASAKLILARSPFNKFSHPIELAIVFLALLIAGGGDFALGHIIMPLRNKWYQ